MRDRDKVKRSIKISFNPSDRIDEYIGVYEERFRIGFIKFWRKIGYILDREGIFYRDGSLLSHHLSANRITGPMRYIGFEGHIRQRMTLFLIFTLNK